MGVLMGNVLGDALGAPFEFSPIEYGTTEMKLGFEEKDIWTRTGYNSFQLQPGQWTDDASMALCLAESLIANNGFNPIDLRLRFYNWWQLGYCNAFGYDTRRKFKESVGLGGNISMSMNEFQNEQKEYTETGDLNTSGNGSIMRNAPIPMFFWNSPLLAMEFAYKQSKTTHKGEEAAECCRLLTYICTKAIQLGTDASASTVLGDLQGFSSSLYSVMCLAASLQEERREENKSFHLEDRNWNWKDPQFKYSTTRATKQPGYIGSYAMDGLAMALHCVWTTNSFSAALLKCANLRGDADTVAAVAGQIAGAIYGYSSIPNTWIQTVRQWDPEANIEARAYLLWVKGQQLSHDNAKEQLSHDNAKEQLSSH
eukprot:TRINITY_DN2686_c0_g1_i2.p1 TRINITY_DN2686_c0_g1~~TRINITY_DN2686_c0_g1_i2.p1  ORF type:complete len:369 (-),score=54.14 TRINITY_DN2686_c0_g1_i2:39-1145(-)